MNEQQPTPQPEQTTAAEQNPGHQPRIWVGSWADYNNGVLHGEWIDADQDEDEINGAILAVLKASPIAKATGGEAEEWGIFDYENFGTLRIDEQDPVAWVAKVGQGVAEHGPAFAAWASLVCQEDALDNFEDHYIGHYESLEAFAQEYIDDTGFESTLDRELPESIRPYVHVDAANLARDMELSGDIQSVPNDHGGVWIFHG